jgi:hypothetical protein
MAKIYISPFWIYLNNKIAEDLGVKGIEDKNMAL